MAKRRSRGGRRDARAVSRRERKAGLYMKPGDPEFKDLAAQLRVQGLRLRDVPGDGNCLFRALAEQLADHHSNLRQRAVQHIRAHRTDYAPFLDEDTSFESYVDELCKDGTFAGNDAIVAVSRVYAVNIVIHQLGAACWEVRAPMPMPSYKTLHIAYLKGEHYCSVQPLASVPQVGAKQQGPKTAQLKPSGENESDLQHLLEATGCQDRQLAEQCYSENGGNVDLAIVELLQLMTFVEAGHVQVVQEDVPQLMPDKATAGASTLASQGHLSNRDRKKAKAAKKCDSSQHKRVPSPKGTTRI